MGGKGDARGRWRKTKVHKHCVWGREQVTEQERVCVCGREKERERETVVMIDARLPPLCSSEWLQQKKHRITSLTPCSAFFSLSPCVSASRRGLRSQLCRGYAETEPASEARSLAAINKLGLEDHGNEREALDLQLTVWADTIAEERKQKGKKKKKKKKGEGGVWSLESLWMQLINLKKIISSRIRGLEEKDSISSMSLDFKGLTK